ncbi:MAG TPA: hypothetical protein VKR61_01260 [Bryobacteraceae bacterium]|nr:hypothetical protein [Bryobacteraceae bacterium]
MRSATALTAACILLLPAALAFGDDRTNCGRDFETAFQSGNELRIHARSGDIEINGSDAAKIRVSCELRDQDRAREVRIAFRTEGNSGDLRITGGPTNNFRIRIDVPRKLRLFVRSPAGDLTINGVTGDKDVELHAGDLTIAVGAAADYAHADGSVLAGDLSASAFGVTKDGLFRSFEKDNPSGKYRLHAHVGAGDLVLR